MTPAKAREALQDLLTDVRRGTWRPYADEPPQKPQRAPLFGEFARGWLNATRVRATTSGRSSTRRGRSNTSPLYLGDVPVDQITIRSVDQYTRAKIAERAAAQERIRRSRPSSLIVATRPRAPRQSSGSFARQRPRRACRAGASTRRSTSRRRCSSSASSTRCTRRIPHAVGGDGCRSRAKMGRTSSRLSRSSRCWTRPRPLIATHGLDAAADGRCWRPWCSAASESARRCRCAGRISTGRLRVPESKTDAGVRNIRLFGVLRDELAAYAAIAKGDDATAFVFGTRTGLRDSASNVRQRTLGPAVKLANEQLAAASV